MSIRTFTCAATIATLLANTGAGAQTPAPRGLQLTFNSDSTVSLSAQNVSVREILAEWARQCGCYVVNFDKLASAPLSIPITFERTSQAKVLESLLRQATGYVLTARRVGSQGVSNYETIYILPTSTAVAGGYVPPVIPAMPTMPLPTTGAPEDEIPSVMSQPGARPDPPGMGMQPNTTPGPATVPGMAPGTRIPGQMGTPGMFVPIVPINTPQGSGSTASPPGTAPPPMPAVPITALPPQGR